MKLKITKGDYSITLRVKNDLITPDTLLKATQILYKTIDDLNNINNVQSNVQPSFKKYTPVPPKQEEVKEPDRPIIRNRLPNTSVVDLSQLDFKKAVRKNALVRCPSCAQGHCLVAHSNGKMYFMEKDLNLKEFNIIAEFSDENKEALNGMCAKEDTNLLDYFNDLQSVNIVSYDDFNADNETEIFCPICHQSNNFGEWKEAYENPLKFWETEHICDICGGELVAKMSKNSKEKDKVYKCEECGYETIL